MSEHNPSTTSTTDPDDEFERIGRRAGGDLRHQAPPGDLDHVHRSAAARRRTTATLSAVVIVGTVAAVLAALLWWQSDDSAPPAARATGRIAYQEDIGRRQEIFVVGADGSGRQSIGAAVGEDNQVNPDWSPDGTLVAFEGSSGTADFIWIVGADGSQPRQVVECVDPCAWVWEPAWSPDGRSLLFARTVRTGGAATSTLELIEVETGNTAVLATAEPGTIFGGPSWSPDGTAFVAEIVTTNAAELNGDPQAVSLARFDFDGESVTAITPLTNGNLFATTADWSPDGSSIVYAALPAAGAANNDLFMMSPDGSNVRRLTRQAEGGGEARQPTFTSDGQVVVFVNRTGPEGTDGLAQIPTDGGEITPVGSDEFRPGLHPAMTD
jgi:Tol biopolymer transport system component